MLTTPEQDEFIEEMMMEELEGLTNRNKVLRRQIRYKSRFTEMRTVQLQDNEKQVKMIESILDKL